MDTKTPIELMMMWLDRGIEERKATIKDAQNAIEILQLARNAALVYKLRVYKSRVYKSREKDAATT